MTEIDLDYIRKELESRLDGFKTTLKPADDKTLTCVICKLIGSIETGINEEFVGITYFPHSMLLNNT